MWGYNFEKIGSFFPTLHNNIKKKKSKGIFEKYRERKRRKREKIFAKIFSRDLFKNSTNHVCESKQFMRLAATHAKEQFMPQRGKSFFLCFILGTMNSIARAVKADCVPLLDTPREGDGGKKCAIFKCVLVDALQRRGERNL